MKQKKIGPILLSGLIIGPILGSGIILLPPMAINNLGNAAIFSWILIMILGAFFAYIFGKLSIAFPGDSGVANAVNFAFGKHFKQLTASFLIGAVCLGPTAVLMTAGKYIEMLFPGLQIKSEFYALVLLFICVLILLNDISSVGKISLVLSSLIGIILLASGLTVLFFFRKDISLNSSINIPQFGYTTLLLFWAIVGWEIIGNYSMEIKDPEKTISKAVFFSVGVVSIIYLVVAGAVQWIDPAKIATSASIDLSTSISGILVPLLGALSLPIMAIITTALCMSTYLMVVGGVARLIHHQAAAGVFPKLFIYRSKRQVPVAGILALAVVHVVDLSLVHFGVVKIESIVAIANAFFICNALLGILSAMKILKNPLVRFSAAILTAGFVAMLLFSNKIIILVIMVFTCTAAIKQWSENKVTVEMN